MISRPTEISEIIGFVQAIVYSLIKKLINERNEARKLKNFEKADEIRQNLKNKNIEIEDTKDGTVWTKSK